jgi:hypothetical protein
MRLQLGKEDGLKNTNASVSHSYTGIYISMDFGRIELELYPSEAIYMASQLLHHADKHSKDIEKQIKRTVRIANARYNK